MNRREFLGTGISVAIGPLLPKYLFAQELGWEEFKQYVEKNFGFYTPTPKTIQNLEKELLDYFDRPVVSDNLLIRKPLEQDGKITRELSLKKDNIEFKVIAIQYSAEDKKSLLGITKVITEPSEKVSYTILDRNIEGEVDNLNAKLNANKGEKTFHYLKSIHQNLSGDVQELARKTLDQLVDLIKPYLPQK